MIALADTIPPDINVAVPQMEGVTTAIVAFIFVCVIYPNLVKHKTQFYGAFVSVLLIILLHSLNMMFGEKSAGFQVAAGAFTGLLQIVAIVMLFMGCGGVGVKQLAGEMARAYEVMRRGEEEKTIIIPIGGEQPRPRQQPHASVRDDDDDDVPQAQKIDAPPTAGWPTKKPGDSKDSSLPLE